MVLGHSGENCSQKIFLSPGACVNVKKLVVKKNFKPRGLGHSGENCCQKKFPSPGDWGIVEKFVFQNYFRS